MSGESREISNNIFQGLNSGDLVTIILKQEFGVSVRKTRIIDELFVLPKEEAEYRSDDGVVLRGLVSQNNLDSCVFYGGVEGEQSGYRYALDYTQVAACEILKKRTGKLVRGCNKAAKKP